MVLTAVSLLGVESPAITSLPDLAEFMNAETPPVQITAGGGMPQPVAARTNVEDVRREFYDQVAQGDQYWWWIRAVELDPENQLIVDDDDGKLYRMPFTTGTDGIVFSDPIPVAVEYNDIAASKVMANAAVTFAKADSTRPVDRVKATNTREDSVANTDLDATGVTASTAEEEEGTTPSAPEEPAPDAPDEGDGDDEDTQEDEEAVEEPSARILAGKLPKGVVVLDEQSSNQLKAGAAAGAEVKAKMDKQDKDALINGAIKAGKFPPARKAHYSAMYDADPVGTRDLIENVLQEGTIPMQARGTVGQDNGDPSSTAQFSGGAAYDPSWLSETERRHISAAKGA
jgi:hypothetical protein